MREIVVLAVVLLSRCLIAQDIVVENIGQTKPESPKATIVTAVECKACPAAKLLLKPWLERGGWSVDFEEHARMQPKRQYPFLRLCWGGSCKEVELEPGEKVTLGNFDNRMRIALRLPAAIKKTLSTPKRWAQHEGHYTPSVVGMTIEYHLTHDPHNVDITGLTVEQMEALHQQLHR